MVQDMVSLNAAPVEMNVSRTGGEIEVMVKNRSALAAEGFVDMIVPSAHWTELAGHGETTVHPRRAAVYVSPFGVQRILFRASGGEVDFSMVAKLAANGSVVYEGVE
jgi:hypothetical protein